MEDAIIRKRPPAVKLDFLTTSPIQRDNGC